MIINDDNHQCFVCMLMAAPIDETKIMFLDCLIAVYVCILLLMVNICLEIVL